MQSSQNVCPHTPMDHALSKPSCAQMEHASSGSRSADRFASERRDANATPSSASAGGTSAAPSAPRKLQRLPSCVKCCIQCSPRVAAVFAPCCRSVRRVERAPPMRTRMRMRVRMRCGRRARELPNRAPGYDDEQGRRLVLHARYLDVCAPKALSGGSKRTHREPRPQTRPRSPRLLHPCALRPGPPPSPPPKPPPSPAPPAAPREPLKLCGVSTTHPCTAQRKPRPSGKERALNRQELLFSDGGDALKRCGLHRPPRGAVWRPRDTGVRCPTRTTGPRRSSSQRRLNT